MAGEKPAEAAEAAVPVKTDEKPEMVIVLMHRTMRPRHCRKLLEGEQYRLPKPLADRLVSRKWAEIVPPELEEIN
jgi:hypothetical protein